MEEAQRQRPASYQRVSGNYNAIVQGEGNPTVNIALPPLTQQWLKPARLVLSKPFVGRQQLVDALIVELSGGKSVTITGMGGIGKTYLALKLAGELYDRFPGGIIRIDVGPQVTDEASAQLPLGRLAIYAFNGLAPPGPYQPEQVAAWLDATAPGPFLVLFDDLWKTAPLRLLSRALPPQAVRLATTRFANVAQASGANIVPLDRLDSGDGLALLEDRLHCQGYATHRAALEAIVKLLGGHAFALELAAAQIRKPTHINLVLQDLEQGIGQGRLDSLQLAPGEDRDENLERSFALGYERMTTAQQRLFRALGVFAEESLITAEAAAALWGMDNTSTAQRALFDLADLALLTELEEITGDDATANTTTIAAFRQHALLRLYARALLDREHELQDASRAHAQFYTDRSWQAISSSLIDYEFLDRHLPNLLAAMQWSENNDLSLFTELLDAIDNFLLIRGKSIFLETSLPKAVIAAHTLGNTFREANLLVALGDVEGLLGNFDQASRRYNAALSLYRAVHDRRGEARALVSLGDLEISLGSIEQARAHYNKALLHFAALRDYMGAANTLLSLGHLEGNLGNLDQALADCEAALPLFRIEGNRVGEANVYLHLGQIFIAKQNWTEAREYLEKALSLFTLERHPLGTAGSLLNLGRILFELGEHEQGMENVQRAIDWYRRAQNPSWANCAEKYLEVMHNRLKTMPKMEY